MRIVAAILALVAISAFVLRWASHTPLRAADSESATADAKLLRHIVLYKFREGLPEAEVQAVVDKFCAMAAKINTVVSLEHGLNNSAEGKSDGLTHAFIVTFRDAAGRKTYLKHPAHLDYVQFAKDRREKVVVFDYVPE